jgi:hypothetical protein
MIARLKDGFCSFHVDPIPGVVVERSITILTLSKSEDIINIPILLTTGFLGLHSVCAASGCC